MINIKSVEKFEAYIKRAALNNVERGFKRFAKQHYDECEVVYDEFTNSFRLLYNGYFIPRHFTNKSDFQRVEEMTFRQIMTEKGVD